MTNLTVNINAGLKEQAKIKALDEGISLSGLVTQLLKSAISEQIELGYRQAGVLKEENREALKEVNLMNTPKKSVDLTGLSADALQIYQKISESLVGVDELCIDLDMPTPKVCELVVYLELNGFIKKRGGCFEINNI